MNAFAENGIRVVEDRATSVARTGDGQILVRTERGLQAVGERLLVATGRSPNTGELGLDRAGVATDARGFVVTDVHQRTSNPRVFAAGDVSGAPQYVYVAAQTGHAAAAGALGDPTSVDYTGCRPSSSPPPRWRAPG